MPEFSLWRIANRLNEYLKQKAVHFVERQAEPEDLLPEHYEYCSIDDYLFHIRQTTDPYYPLQEFEQVHKEVPSQFASRIVAFMLSTVLVAWLFSLNSQMSPGLASWQLSAAELFSLFVNYPFYSLEWAIIVLFVPSAIYALWMFGVGFVRSSVLWSDKLVNLLWWLVVFTFNFSMKISHRILVRYAAYHYYRQYSNNVHANKSST